MSTLMFTAIVFIATFMAALLGFMLQRLVPNRDLDDRSQGNAKLLFGSLSMLTTIVLGFVISDGKTSFDKASRLVADTAVRFVQIDRALADFGPAAAKVRSDMKQSAQEWIAYAHSPSGTVTVLEAIQGGERLDDVFDQIKTLEPTSEALARQQAQATELAAVICHNRWLMISEDLASTPNAFLIIMLACLMLEFFNFGLFAKRNELITGLTLITALVKAGSIFVILDLQGPTTGLIRVPTELLERAVAAMGH